MEGGAVEWQRAIFGKCVETHIMDKRERERDDLGQAYERWVTNSNTPPV